jgi:RNA polymerase sigma-70 factor (ECF subfamily)
MAGTVGYTTKLQGWLDLLRAGNAEAQSEVIAHTCDRLRKLTRKMLKGYPGVGRWSQTDDVLQNAMLRLHRALADVKP